MDVLLRSQPTLRGHWVQAQQWQHYIASDTSSSAYVTDEGLFVTTGGFVTTTSQVWTVPSHVWTWVYLRVYTKATGYKWVSVPANQAFSPARYWNGWCGYS